MSKNILYHGAYPKIYHLRTGFSSGLNTNRTFALSAALIPIPARWAWA